MAFLQGVKVLCLYKLMFRHCDVFLDGLYNTG